MNNPTAIKAAFNKVEKTNKLVDLKLPPEPKYKEDVTRARGMDAPSEPRYPYGMQIRFENDQVQKMQSLMKLNVGDEVSITGKGEVIKVRMREEKGGEKCYTVEIQVKKVSVI